MSRGRPQPPPGRPQSAKVVNSAARGGLAGRRPVSAGPKAGAGIQEERGAGDGGKEPHEHGAGRSRYDAEATVNVSVESVISTSHTHQSRGKSPRHYLVCIRRPHDVTRDPLKWSPLLQRIKLILH